MIRRAFLVLLPILFLCFCTEILWGQSDIIINIYEPGTARIKIGIPSFVEASESAPLSQPDFGVGVAQVLRDDLSFTGLFNVYESPSGGQGAEQNTDKFAPLNAWIPLDVQAVVQGKYKFVRDRIRLECSLFDVESETRIVGRFYTGYQKTIRQIAHKFSDEIVYRYTGNHGIARTSIAYVKLQDKRKEIHIMDYDGHNSYRLTYDKSIALSPAWSPDGDKIVFTSYKDNNPDVYIIDLSERSYVRISGFIGLNTTPAFSPNGKTLALTLSKDGNPELYLMKTRNGELERLTRNSRIDTSPTWSPNGREIAFVSDRSGYPQIYVTDREGVNLRRLTYEGYNNTSPAWSPEGDRIAYVSMVSGRPDIFTISPTGTDNRRLTYGGGNEDPCWSRDGKYLAYSSKQGGQRDIYLMRANGSGRRRITFGGGDNMSPAWSP